MHSHTQGKWTASCPLTGHLTLKIHPEHTGVVDAHPPPQHGLQAPDLRQPPVLRPQPPQRPGHKHLASDAGFVSDELHVTALRKCVSTS